MNITRQNTLHGGGRPNSVLLWRIATGILAAVSLPYVAASDANAIKTGAPASLIRNGSFEAGLTHGDWGVVTRGAGPILHATNLDAAGAYHGAMSLRLSAGQTLFSAPFVPSSGLYRVQVALKTDGNIPVVVSIASERMAAEGATVPSVIYGSNRAPATVQWQLVSFMALLTNTPVHLRIAVPPGGCSNCWIDAASVMPAQTSESSGAGPSVQTVFMPRSQVEAGLFCKWPGNIFYQEEGVILDGWIANYGTTPQTVTLAGMIVNISGASNRPAGPAGMAIAPGARAAVQWKLPGHPNGLFSLRYWLEEYPQNSGEVVYSVIPRPAERSLLGALSSATPELLSILQRAGIRTFYAMTDTWLRPEQCWRNGPNYTWHDDSAALPGRYGMQVCGTLWYYRLIAPANGNWPATDVVPLDTPLVGRKRAIPAFKYLPHDVWRTHVATVAAHYKNWINDWILDDELNGAYPPREYVPIIRDARQALRETDPRLKLGVSASVQWLQEIADLGGLDDFDAVAGSIGEVGYWEKWKTGWFAEKYGKEIWECAIIKHGTSFYHTHIPKSDWLQRATSAYRNTINSFFQMNPNFISPYIFRLVAFSSTADMPKSMLDYDGGLKSQGFGFVMAGALAGRWERLADQPRLDALVPYWSAYLFRENRRLGVWLSGGTRTLQFPLASDKLEMFDWLGNPADLGITETNAVVFREAYAPFYLLTRPGGDEQEFCAAVRAMRLLPPENEFTAFFGRSNGIMQAAVAIDPVSGKGMIRATQPIVYDGRRPRENRAGWLMNAARLSRPPRLDGNLEEWTTRSGGNLNVEWNGLAPLSRGENHIVAGGEYIRWNAWDDLKAHFYAGYDDQYLYLAANVNDDDVAPPEIPDRHDGLEFRFDLDVLKTLGDTALSADDYRLPLTIGPDRKARAVLISAAATNIIEATNGLRAGGYTVECRIPWTKLGGWAPTPWKTLGFDVFVDDVDYDRIYSGAESFKREYSRLRWAFGVPIGQMVLLPAMQ